MSRKFTNEEIVNMAHLCVKNACDKCPLLRSTKCRYYLARYIVDTKENEPALSANSTSSEVSKDTSSILHLDDSTLLDICQEGIEEMAKIALDDYPNEFLTGYIEAFKDNIKRLRGGEGNG